jgi:hypothetical protein
VTSQADPGGYFKSTISPKMVDSKGAPLFVVIPEEVPSQLEMYTTIRKWILENEIS